MKAKVKKVMELVRQAKDPRRKDAALWLAEQADNELLFSMYLDEKPVYSKLPFSQFKKGCYTGEVRDILVINSKDRHLLPELTPGPVIIETQSKPLELLLKLSKL